MNVYKLMETDIFPDWVIRMGIRTMLKQKIKEHTEAHEEIAQQKKIEFVNELKNSPIAIETDSANEQHYELPAEFFHMVLGERKKYSSAYWTDETKTLQEAEEAMLSLYCERAELKDGMSILDLGCGWGSLSLWLAEQYPNSDITGLSNSSGQRAYIMDKAKAKGLSNLKIITANVVEYDFDMQFDRVMSIEMLEHMKNYERLFEKISRWLKEDGLFFTHIFTHKNFAYHYEDTDGNDWLTRHFFTGGTMPSNDLFHYFQKDLTLINQWALSGVHYEKTANEWLKNQYVYRDEIRSVFETTYGKKDTTRWWVYWKVFFMACAELWGYENGSEWMVSHYLFSKHAVSKVS